MERAITRALILCAAPAWIVPAAAAAEVTTLYANDFESAGPLGSEWGGSRALTSHPAFSTFLGRFGSQRTQLSVSVPPVPLGRNDSNVLAGRFDLDDGALVPGPTFDGGGSPGGSPGGPVDPIDVDDTFAFRPIAPVDVTYTVVFDLYLIDSWDGRGGDRWGDDKFRVTVNGQVLLDSFFSNFNIGLSGFTPDVGPAQLGYNDQWPDTIYRDLALEFTLADGVDTVAIDFRGTLNQALSDESWGLDNVRVIRTIRDEPTPLGAIPGPSTLAALGAAGVGGLRKRRSLGKRRSD